MLDELLQSYVNLPECYRDIAGAAFYYASCCKKARSAREAVLYLGKSVNIYNTLRPECPRKPNSLSSNDISELLSNERFNAV